MKKRIVMYSLAVMITCVHLLPFYILMNVAFKSPQDTSSKWLVPGYLYWGNFVNAWQAAKLGNALLNNVIITGCSVALVVLFGSCAAYPLARIRSRLNTVVYLVIVSCMIVPALTILVPLYKFMVDVKGLNTYWGIIAAHVTFFLPISIFLFTGFITTIPKELDEAATIDGAHGFAIFMRIILPLLKPITATIIILAGVGIWNDYQFSVFFLQKREFYTVPVALAQFFSQFSNEISWVAAGCFIGSIPMATVYLFLQKYFIKGLSAGAVKG